MEIVNEVIESLKDLSNEKKAELAKDIAGKFKLWDDDRNEQIDTARSIMDEVYLHQGKKKQEKELEWKSDVKLNALYNIKRTRKAQLWSEMWSNSEQMFDVKGTNEQTEGTAKQQKAAIVDSLNRMEVQRQYDKVADDLFDIGEMIFKTDWEQRKKVVKRQRKDVGFVVMNVLRNAMGSGYTMSEKMQDVEIPYYENARVEEVSPFMFVFDHTKYIKGDKKRWDSLWKIYKRFDTFENIRNNKVYNLTPEIIERFENKESQEKTAENK